MKKIDKMTQSPSAVVMVRPHHFVSNPETAEDNAFQQLEFELPANKIAKRALMEVTYAANKLIEHGITVHLFDDITRDAPDSVFPNNWLSTHADGSLIVYPMYCPNRRHERRAFIIDAIKDDYCVKRIIDYSNFEQENLFLEGTGSLVLDRVLRIAYATNSNRTDSAVLQKFCEDMNYRPVIFDAVDNQDVPIYHTNVLMNIATDFVLIGSNLIGQADQRRAVLESLEASGREIIELSNNQVFNFAANAFELKSPDGQILALSETAYRILTDEQKRRIEKYAQWIVLNVPTIERAGGSVRCMLAGIHMSVR